MRTTIDLPDDLHAVAAAFARDRGITLSQAVAEIMRKAVSPPALPRITISSVTGLPVLETGTVITSEDVRAMEDEW
ncbi:MAG TPA: antitoxin [Actinomycetota bacterium]|nr:antitoxin [Actinomycetota bacterium]